MYGCLGTAKFKLVEEFTEITFKEALERLNNYRVVYYKWGAEYKELSRYTDFAEMFVKDLSDLMNTRFFVKGGK